MIGKLSAWWRARQRREQALVGVAITALVLASAELAVLGPMRSAKATLQREILAGQSQLDKLRASAAELAAQQAPAGSVDALQARRERALARIDRAEHELIGPQDMARQLESILVRHPQLRIVGMQSIAPQVADAAGRSTPLYEHALRIDVEGRYLDLLAYLDALERAPRRIFWRSLDMNADGKVPVTRVELFTLSREPVWLRL